MAVRAGKVGIMANSNQGVGEGNTNQTFPAGTVGKPTIHHQRKASRDGSDYGFGSDAQNSRHRRRPSSGEEGSFSNLENGAIDRISREKANSGLGVSPRHPHGYVGRRTGSASPMVDKTGTPGTPNRNRGERYGVTVPKFGDWDVNNPASADGFTIIFDKALDEKKAGGALRATDSPLRTDMEEQKTHSGSGNSSWFCGCFHPSTV